MSGISHMWYNYMWYKPYLVQAISGTSYFWYKPYLVQEISGTSHTSHSHTQYINPWWRRAHKTRPYPRPRENMLLFRYFGETSYILFPAVGHSAKAIEPQQAIETLFRCRTKTYLGFQQINVQCTSIRNKQMYTVQCTNIKIPLYQPIHIVQRSRYHHIYSVRRSCYNQMYSVQRYCYLHIYSVRRSSYKHIQSL